ncbi:hypothetical protein DSAG12_03454 [Promethearchaeum syntrophicum]|uniref:Uncharacterized protein n=1 Tax=Promethearchaeum syntrophicum TaxID=2594042 RepID=A0A5B9DG19_9ARCH|nr:hypothetical protein [Candidatus Prometheoarchaeum syntrophicum]QEE17617.1 hypothetical protein DSAG12_03454 [Candidatus Prometheoarchaeum syntrophicum]
MKKEEFLVWFIKFSGILEILFGLCIIFLTSLMDVLELPNFPFWEWSFGLSLAFMGVLLWYSGRNLKKYLIIPLVSIFFRLILAGIELYVALTVPKMFYFLLGGAIYDFFSPLLTIILLKQLNYLHKGSLS